MPFIEMLKFQREADASDKQIEFFGRSITVDTAIKIMKNKPSDVDIDDYVEQLGKVAALIKSAGL